ncbi:sugar phosphate isomerase/epimerase [Paraburkholderia sp. UYCP14C]|uniref:sugar phosphate isomerase/epimerase family protein n=1 Tax=Paraburkholderia sp. UYCP14C TaxID=2511130 RepID=UPI0010225401|nr:sugar phosphate isomerase/epimerase [Paraburkholderia sp. UYCP14C]RZF29346.1 sugar phosphate isomerase/epimerase [Paraburkholderia sp. UYCP14C]
MNQALPISIQIYSLRKAGDLDRQFDIAAQAGFRQVELIGSLLEDAADTRNKLQAHGLRASSSHLSMTMLRERLDDVTAACETIGFTQLIMPAVPPAERDSDAAYWRALGTELGEFAHRLADRGIALAYHNHDWELRAKENGVTALELLFESAGESPLGWQVDVAWLVRGGADPLPWLRRYTGRVVSAHAKDLAPTGEKLDEDGWADVGHGVMDWPTLSAACRAAGARFLAAEHDNPSDAERFARNAFAYLHQLGA